MRTSLVPVAFLPWVKGNLLLSLSHLEGFIANLSVQRQFFPTDEDEMGAAKALMRLQDTYKLDSDTISKGELPGDLPLLALPVQPVILLQCLGRTAATAHLRSLPPGAPSPLAVSLFGFPVGASPPSHDSHLPRALSGSRPPCMSQVLLVCCSGPPWLCPQHTM